MVEANPEKKQSRSRYDHLRKIEVATQEEWATKKIYEREARPGYEATPVDEKNKEKYLITFPYPYMNGFLHLGHAFSLSKCEFTARYQTQIGKNVLFPFSFHCTGMPIAAAARRLKRELETGNTKSQQPDPADKKAAKVPLTQFEILQQIGIPDAEIPEFQDPIHWLRYFPPHAQQDLKDLGIHTDWRRSFITTVENPFYNAFVEWQFKTLKEAGKIKFGKRPTIYSELDGQPCADHDRSKGEGFGPQEYTLIKIEMLELPESLKQFEGKKVIMPAATLRPETMYGQTNCYVLPDGEYGAFEMVNDEIFICSERSAKNMAYQDLTKEPKKYPVLTTVKGKDLIGCKLKAPLAKYDFVYALPMETISMNKGTGIVTSVPSDSPDDWAALKDLQEKEGKRQHYGVKEEWVVPFPPVPIIEIPGYGNLTAVKLVEDLGIKSQKDKVKLAEAKDIAYLKGFNEGVMIVEERQGVMVKDAKPIIKDHLISINLGATYYEPEDLVVSRQGDECIVALCDQWLLNYGEESWRDFCMEHVVSDNFSAYTTQSQQEFVGTLNWLKEWGCSRTTGLGTKIPWDEQFVIESLSDSTIYMAYYTISHLLQGGVLNGQQEGPLGIKATDMTKEVFDYIYKKGPYPEGCAIEEEKLQKLRYEFEYWYPMDLRCSGKDLIKNHLTMSLYNHAAIWNDKDMMPRSFFCNGYIMLDGDKMSKSTGNFLTLRDCINEYGADATRIALADAGDTLNDANFERTVANSAILKLYVLEEWIKTNLAKFVPEGFDFNAEQTNDPFDQIFENEINEGVRLVKNEFAAMRFRDALKYGFFQFLGLKEDYLISKTNEENIKEINNVNPRLILAYTEAQLVFLNVFCPHFAQNCWSEHYLPAIRRSQNAPAKPDQLSQAGWPEPSRAFDPLQRSQYNFLKNLKSQVHLALEKSRPKGKGGKKGKGAPKEEQKNPENCALFVALEYPEWKRKALGILNGVDFDENNKMTGDYKQAFKEAFEGKQVKDAMSFASFAVKEAEQIGKAEAFALTTAFDEKELIEKNRAFVFENYPIKNRVIKMATEEDIENSSNIRESAAPSKPSVMFF